MLLCIVLDELFRSGSPVPVFTMSGLHSGYFSKIFPTKMKVVALRMLIPNVTTPLNFVSDSDQLKSP